jgi:chemotaxis signal transduction protein
MRAIIPAMAGSTWFVLDALAVQEVLGMRTWVPLAHASPETPGVLSWRGRAVAVLDVRPLLGAGELLAKGTTCARTLVVQGEGCTLAIPVDAVREVHEVNPSDVRPFEDAAEMIHDAVVVGEKTMPRIDLGAVLERLLREPAEG